MTLKNDLIDFIKQNKNLRNPVITINGVSIGVIGDVHVGKTFRTGVPKNRLGERESMILNQLTELLNRDVDYTILVGDLFDKVRVSNSDLYNLISIIEEAVSNKPETIFAILNGNHDMPKEVDRISSFQLFEKYFERASLKNLKIISKHSDTNLITVPDKGVALYLSHYNAFQSLDEELPDDFLPTTFIHDYPDRIAFGHWETVDFGSDHFIDRCVPDKVLKNFSTIVTGHEHKPKLTLIEEVPVLTSGSMQPYAYGEELSYEKDFYVTITAEDVVTKLKENPDIFINSYVKILVENTDDLVDPFECLGRTYKKVLTKLEDKSRQEEVPVTTEPLSFQKSLVNLIKDLSEAQPNQAQFLEEIEKTFLDKSYKETT